MIAGDGARSSEDIQMTQGSELYNRRGFKDAERQCLTGIGAAVSWEGFDGAQLRTPSADSFDAS